MKTKEKPNQYATYLQHRARKILGKFPMVEGDDGGLEAFPLRR
jgi:hypothetical protein